MTLMHAVISDEKASRSDVALCSIYLMVEPRKDREVDILMNRSQYQE